MQELPLPLINFITLTPFSEIVDFFFFYSAFKQLFLLRNQNTFCAKNSLLGEVLTLLNLLQMLLSIKMIFLFQGLQLIHFFLFTSHFILDITLMPISCLQQLFCLLICNIRQLFGSAFLEDKPFYAILKSIWLLLAVFVEVPRLKHL